MSSSKVVVVGSCMMDFVSYAPRLPQEGETIHGSKFVTTFGGKGANQCVAAAKLGANTTLIARVGDDLWGEKYIDNLKQRKIQTDYVWKTADTSTGIAQIVVSDSGQNQIVIIAGANNFLTVDDLEKATSCIREAAVLVVQLETSQEVALKSLRLSQGISILNGAPALSQYHEDLLKLPTIFCVNESEASIFTGLPVTNKQEAEIVALKLISKGCNSVVLTLGSEGVIYVEKSDRKVIHVTCPKVKCLDSTGAGDAFIGALAFMLANCTKQKITEKLKVACFVASDSVTKPGTQISFPDGDILKRCT